MFKSKKAFGIIGLIVIIIIILIAATFVLGVIIPWGKAKASYIAKYKEAIVFNMTHKEYFNVSVRPTTEPYVLSVSVTDPNGKYVSYFDPLTGFRIWEDRSETYIQDIEIYNNLFVIFLLDASKHVEEKDIEFYKNFTEAFARYGDLEREKMAVYALKDGTEAKPIINNTFVNSVREILDQIPDKPSGDAYLWDGILLASGVLQNKKLETEEPVSLVLIILSSGNVDATSLETLDEAKALAISVLNDSEIELYIVDIKDQNCNKEALAHLKDLGLCYGPDDTELLFSDLFSGFNEIRLKFKPLGAPGTSHNITVQVSYNSLYGRGVLRDYAYE